MFQPAADRVAGDQITEAVRAARVADYVTEVGRAADVSGVARQGPERKSTGSHIARAPRQRADERVGSPREQEVAPILRVGLLVLLARVRGQVRERVNLAAQHKDPRLEPVQPLCEALRLRRGGVEADGRDGVSRRLEGGLKLRAHAPPARP